MVSQTNPNESEKRFKKAVSLGLSMDHDMAMAKLNLAGIAFTKGRKQEATILLKEAESLDKQGVLKDQVKLMKDNMKRPQGPKQHYGQGGQPQSARAQRRASKR